MNSKTITLETKVARNINIATNKIDDEVIMMSLEKGNYYSVNSIGTRIWNIIEQEKNVKEICDTLLQEYDIDKEHCEKAVIAFLEKMKTADLLTIS